MQIMLVPRRALAVPVHPIHHRLVRRGQGAHRHVEGTEIPEVIRLQPGHIVTLAHKRQIHRGVARAPGTDAGHEPLGAAPP